MPKILDGRGTTDVLFFLLCWLSYRLFLHPSSLAVNISEQRLLHWCAIIQHHPSSLLCLLKAHPAKKVREWTYKSIYSFVASLHRRLSNGLHRIFPSLYHWGPPSVMGLTEALHGRKYFKPKPDRVQWGTRMNRNTASNPEKSSHALIVLSVWMRGTLNRRGGTNQTNLLQHSQKIRAWQKPSCWEEECSGVTPYKHSLGDYHCIRHGSECGGNMETELVCEQRLCSCFLWHLFNQNLFG